MSPDDLCVCGGKREAHEKDGPPYLRCDEFEPVEGPIGVCACDAFTDSPCPVHPDAVDTINADARAVKAMLGAGDAPMTTTLATEARKARMRYQDRGAFAGSSEAAQQACWEEAVRPLVEEIERLRNEAALRRCLERPARKAGAR